MTKFVKQHKEESLIPFSCRLLFATPDGFVRPQLNYSPRLSRLPRESAAIIHPRVRHVRKSYGRAPTTCICAFLHTHLVLRILQIDEALKIENARRRVCDFVKRRETECPDRGCPSLQLQVTMRHWLFHFPVYILRRNSELIVTTFP